MRIMGWSLFEPYPVLRRVIVNLKSGTAIRAVVWGRRGQWLILREALLRERGQTAPVPLDGEVAVVVADIDYIQVLS
jgi:hypothetical protein